MSGAGWPLGLGAVGAAGAFAVTRRPEAAAIGGLAGVVAGVAVAAASRPSGPSVPIPAGGGGGGLPGPGEPIGGPFVTPLAAMRLHPSGWARLEVPGLGLIEVVRLPAIDARAPHLFARPTYPDAAAWARANGARMMVHPVIQAVWDRGVRLVRCTQPADSRMRSRGACEAHDACVWAQLEGRKPTQRGTLTWDGSAPVANCGKDKLEGAVPGYNFNGGWIEPDGRWLQQGVPGQKTHDAHHTDYSELARIWRHVGEG